MNTLIARSSAQTKYLNLLRHSAILPPVTCRQNDYRVNSSAVSCNRPSIFLPEISPLLSINKTATLQSYRHFSKKKKTSKVQEEIEESDEEDSQENLDSDEMVDEYNLVTKYVASLRLDSVLKAGFGLSKKKIEKEFYAAKMYINGEKVLKKAATIHIDDEVDIVKGPNPDNIKLILVDRIVIKSVGKPNENGNFPLKMQILKSLIIENYSDPWVKSSLADNN